MSYGRAYGNDSTVCGINLDYTNMKYFQDFNRESFLSDYIKERTNFSKPHLDLKLNIIMQKSLIKVFINT